jgi:hypothetical protein
VLHIGLICKVKDIVIFSIPSSAFSWSLFFQFLGLEFIIQIKMGVIHNWSSKIWNFNSSKFHAKQLALNVNIHVHIVFCKCSNYFEAFPNGFHYLKGITPYLLLSGLIHQWWKCLGRKFYCEIYIMVPW